MFGCTDIQLSHALGTEPVMWLVCLPCFAASMFLSLFGIRYYIRILRYPAFLLVPVVLAVFMPLSIIFLLPIDYISHHVKHTFFEVPESVILFLWKSNYWITFFLTWLILPFLQSFYSSGHYNNSGKVKDAIRRNLRFQLIMLAVSIFGAIYLMLEAGLTVGHMKLMVIALAHLYSLLLALWLMSHGMVSIPRTMWISGSVLLELNYHYVKVPPLVDHLEDSKVSLQEDALQVMVMARNFGGEGAESFQYRDWILLLSRKIPDDISMSIERQFPDAVNETISRDKLTVDYMTKLNARFNVNLERVVAYKAEFDTLFRKIIILEDIEMAKASQEREVHYRIDNFRANLSPKLGLYVHGYFAPAVRRIWSLCLFAMSFLILESEMLGSHLSLINKLLVASNSSFWKLAFSCTTFSYMLFAALNSLTKVKIFNMYHLVPHNSDPVSVCFFTTYIARLTIPLSYNFLTLFASRESVFESWFGKSIHLTGLFNILNDWLPRLVLLPVILTTFNIYDRLKRRLGLDSWAFDDDEELGQRADLQIVEAKRIINREMFKRLQQGDPTSLREFNLASAANTNYQANRQLFHDSLSNRIDNPAIDSDQESEPSNKPGIWGRMNNVVNGVAARFTTNNPTQPYRDDVL